jgi:hypothetical protein
MVTSFNSSWSTDYFCTYEYNLKSPYKRSCWRFILQYKRSFDYSLCASVYCVIISNIHYSLEGRATQTVNQSQSGCGSDNRHNLGEVLDER